MRRFLTKLAESPLAQTWLVLGMLAIAFIVDEVGVWITDDRIGKVYGGVMIPFVYVLYLALFLIEFAMFFFATQAWVRVDHGEDATIGPCTYYGRPLSFSMSAPGLSIMHSAAHFKCLNFVFDIIFWCGMAWLVLFAPDIRRSCQERRVCSQATSGI